MQRVLYEILRRSNEGVEKSQSRKRKAENLFTRDDGKYAEELFTKETRGPRPGMIDWIAKRRRVEEWDISGMKRTYLVDE